MKLPFRKQTVLLAVLALSVMLSSAAPVRAQIQSTRAKNDLGQIALFYHTFLADMLRAPKTLGEFTTYLKRDAPKLVKALENGTYVLVLVKKPTSNVVLAYVKQADRGKKHVVVRGDKSVTVMTTAELQKALKNSE
jgi:hypothetical protein